MATTEATSGKGVHDERYRALIDILIDGRRKLGLSQHALADQLGRHQQFVSRYELGERRLDVVEYADIATALNLDPSRLIKTISDSAND